MKRKAVLWWCGFVLWSLTMTFGTIIWIQACDHQPLQSQPIMAWDAVTAYEDGSPIANELVIMYKVYVEKVGTDTVDLLLTTNDAQATLNLPEKDTPYYVGVAADDGIQESEIAWSYNPVFCQNEKTFQVQN